MPINPIKTRLFNGNIDPDLLLYIDARYIESYSGGPNVINLSKNNLENTGDGIFTGIDRFGNPLQVTNQISWDTEEGGSFKFKPLSRSNRYFIDFTPNNQLQISNRQNVTYTAYVKPEIPGAGLFDGLSIIDTTASDASSYSIGYGVNNNNRFFFGGPFGLRWFSSRLYPENKWYHITYTKTYNTGAATSVRATYKFYVDGILQEEPFTAIETGIATNILRVGRGFEGKISYVKIFNRDLSAAEVIKEYSDSRVKLSSIGTKKTSSDIILYLADKGTNGGWGDNSMYSNGARLVGNVSFDNGLVGNGTLNSYAEGTLSQSPGQNFTISVLFEIYGAGSDPVGQNLFMSSKLSLGESPTNHFGFGLIYIASTKNVLFAWANNAPLSSTSNQINYNQKTQVTVTFNGTTFKIYINGVLQNSETPSPTVTFDFTNRTYNVGYWRHSTFNRPLNGKIFNVILHNRTLSDAEVQNLYAAMPSSYKSNESSQNQIPTSDRVLYVDGAEPKSYYAETGGLTFKDLSGFSRNGTLSRANRLQSGTPKTGTYPEFKKFNGGYFSFNGFLTADASNPDQKGNSYISFSNPGNFLPESGNPSTIIAWARASASGSTEYRYIFSYGTYNATGQNRYVGIKYPDKFSIGGGGASAAILDVDGMIPGQWFQIAFVYISGEMRLFVNGTLKQIKSYTLNTNIPFTSAHIGRGNTPVGSDTNTNDGYFYGDIAQVIVYDRALNEQEIYQHYKATYERFRLPRVTRPTSVAVITNPFVTTIPIEQRTLNSAKSGVIINFDGNTNIQSSGILYRLSSQTGTFEWNGPGVTPINGSSGVLVNITGLSPNTSYQVRGYAWNGSYYGYGEPLTFTTLSVSVLTVVAVTASFTGLFADASGQVTDLGGNTNYTRRGFVWSNSTINVSTADNITLTRVEEVSPIPPFYTNTSEIWNLRIEPLLQTTTYYLRSFAKTQTGNYVYSSNELVFTTYTFATINVIIPTVTGDILSTTAKITGNLLNTGGTTVTQRGIVWSTSQNPTITDSQTNNGPGPIGSFVGQLNGLSAGTLYYVRAYAINSAGIAYSTQASFTTDNVPTVTTSTMLYSNLYPLAYQGPPPPKQSATASGIITDTGNDPITEVGFYYSKTTPVNISTATKVSITTGITNNFAVTLPTLDSSTLYYFVAFAKNINGNGYGSELSFKTLYQPTVLGGSSISQNNSTPGSVTLRSYVDKNNFGNSDFYNQPLTVGFSYAKQPSGTIITQDVSTTYTLNTAQQVVPNNYFTLNLNLDPSSTYTITAYAINKGIAGTLTFNITTFDLPTVTTTVVSNISFDGAQGGGVVTSNGGSTIISRGVVWTIYDLIDPEYGVDTGTDLPGASPTTFNVAISNLDEGTTYYYRSYARNSAGVGYGIKRLLTTTSRVGAATNAATSIIVNSATLNGTTTIDLGGYTDIDEVGFYWSIVEANLPSQPAVGAVVTTTATKVVAGTDVQPVNFTTTITSLTPGTTYYYVAYTKNPAGTSIGLPSRNFVTTSVIKTTVTIGSQGTTTNTSIQITGSNVSSAGGGTVTVRGVCWGTSQFPILGTSNFTSDGGGLGSYNSSITGLVQGTTYYIRAYATNEAGTNYSSTQLTITTFVITTGSVENLFSNKLDVNGSNIVWDTPSITARGVVWSTSPNPQLPSTLKTTDGSGTGLFNSPNVQILSASTTYYIRAYVIHTSGTYYGNQITFTTPAHPPVLGFKLSTNLYFDPTKPSQYHNYSFPPAFNSYQEFKFSINVGLSDIWTPGFVYSTTVNTLAGLVRGGVGLSEFIDTGNARINNVNGTTDFYSGVNVDYNFRPYYIRGFLTDGVNTIYSVVVGSDPGFRQINMPILTPSFIIGNVPTLGTVPFTLTVGSMRPGDAAPVINDVGVIVYPSNNSGVITSGQSYTDTAWDFNGSLPLNASNQFITSIDIRSITTPLGYYTLVGYVEYTSAYDGVIRIYTPRSISQQRQAIQLGAITTGTSGSITTNSATITGSTITSNGGGNITAGVCWGTSTNPTITGSKTTDATIIGTFNSSITGLSGGTVYYVRAYVTNEAGTVYGSPISFTTIASAPLPTLSTLSSNPFIVTSNASGNQTGEIRFDMTVTNGASFIPGVEQSLNSSFSPVEFSSDGNIVPTSSGTIVTVSGFGDFATIASPNEIRYYRGYVRNTDSSIKVYTSNSRSIQFEDIRFTSFFWDGTNFVANIQFNATSGRLIGGINFSWSIGTTDPASTYTGINHNLVPGTSNITSGGTFVYNLPGSSATSGQTITARISLIVVGVRQYSFTQRIVTKP